MKFLKHIFIGGLIVGISMLSLPHKVNATSTVIFLTSGTSWAVPADWNNSNNSIETIGAGGVGGTNGRGGGGGGAYSKITNLALSGNITYQIGASYTTWTSNGFTSITRNTYFNGTSLAGSSVGAQGGADGADPLGGAGGALANGIGTTKYSGGAGGAAALDVGGGGGGAAGLNSSGNNGADAGVGTGGNGGQGDGSYGGTGGAGGNPGASGNPGTEYDASHGSGGGGGGGDNTKAGGNAGAYGAGGGGSGGNPGGVGANSQGLIIITYTPVATTISITSDFLWFE